MGALRADRLERYRRAVMSQTGEAHIEPDYARLWVRGPKGNEVAGARIAPREHVVVASEGGPVLRTGGPGWAVKVGVEVRSNTGRAHECSLARLAGP